MGKKAYELENGANVPFLTSCRAGLAFYGFFGAICLYMLRMNMSVAIVCMTIDPNVTDAANATVAPDDDCPDMGGGSDEPAKETGEFEWPRELRGWVLSAFYVGYLITQIPAGYLSRRFGGKILVGFAMASLGVTTLLTPICARGSVYLLIFMQALKGAVSGFYYPSFFQIWGRWAPPSERSKLIAVCMSGGSIGSVLSSVLSGLLCASNVFGGWPSVFYILGIAPIVWVIGWFFLAFDSPAKHPRISIAEKEYIEGSLGTEEGTKLTVPWRSVLTTVPLYAILVAHFCYGWGWYVALTTLPQYMKDVLKFDIKRNGLYNALPYICNFIVTILGSMFADWLLFKGLSRTWTRKLLQTIGFVPPAALAIGVAFLTCHDVPLAVALLTLWVGLMGCSRSGLFTNLVDVAPAYSGVFMGIDNTFGSIPGAIGPPIVSAITSTGSVSEWQTAFFIGAGICLIGWLVYVAIGSAEEQEWAKIPSPTFSEKSPGGNNERNSDNITFVTDRI